MSGTSRERAGLAPRLLARRVLARVEEGGAWADRAFAAEARRAGLEGRDRALAARLAYGTVQRRRTIDHVVGVLAGRDPTALEPALRDVVRLGAYQLLFADRIPPHAAVATSVDLARRTVGPRATGIVNAVLRRVAAGGRDLVAALPDDTPGGAALKESYPDWIADLWWTAYGPATARALLAAGNDAPELAVRINRLRAGAEERVLAELGQAGVAFHRPADAPDAVVLDEPLDLAASPSFRAGDAVPMSRAAQRVAAFLEVRPGMRVLDACAAPGGKSGQLAAALGGAAGLVCCEQDPGRAAELRDGLARQGADEATIVVADAAELPPALGRFDAILLDAPCSGLGVVAGRPDLRWRRSEDDVPRLAALQRRLLEALLARLEPGGRLVYAVCTLSPAEARGVVAPRVADDELETWPHRGDGDGFYAARLAG